MVVWTSQYQDGSGDGVFGQRFDASGERRGSEFQVDTYTVHHQFFPEVASDAAGNFVVVWQRWQYVGGPPGPVTAFRVLARRYSNSGVRGESPSPGSTLGLFAYPASPAVAIDWAGNFIVSWQSRDRRQQEWRLRAALRRHRCAARIRAAHQYVHAGHPMDAGSRLRRGR